MLLEIFSLVAKHSGAIQRLVDLGEKYQGGELNDDQLRKEINYLKEWLRVSEDREWKVVRGED